MTHLILFSAEVTPSGELSALDRVPRPYLLNKAVTAATKYGRKLLFCIGGNGRSAGFGPVVKSAAARKTFISGLVKLCKDKKFHGIDYNWEYPGYAFGRGYDEAQTKEDYAGLAKLLAETRTAFEEHSLVLTMSYYPDGRQEKLLKEIRAPAHVHLMHMMSYDQPGAQHSSEPCARWRRQNRRCKEKEPAEDTF